MSTRTDLGEEGVDSRESFPNTQYLLDLNLPDIVTVRRAQARLGGERAKTTIKILSGLARHRGQGQAVSASAPDGLHDQTLPQDERVCASCDGAVQEATPVGDQTGDSWCQYRHH